MAIFLLMTIPHCLGQADNEKNSRLRLQSLFVADYVAFYNIKHVCLLGKEETRTWDLKILSLLSAAPSLSYTSMLKVKENSAAGSNKFNSQDLLPDGTKTYNETTSRILPDLSNCHGLKVFRGAEATSSWLLISADVIPNMLKSVFIPINSKLTVAKFSLDGKIATLWEVYQVAEQFKQRLVPVGRWALVTGPMNSRSRVPPVQPSSDIVQQRSETSAASSTSSGAKYTDPDLAQEGQGRTVIDPGKSQSDKHVPTLTETWPNILVNDTESLTTSYVHLQPESSVPTGDASAPDRTFTRPSTGKFNGYVTSSFWTQSIFSFSTYVQEPRTTEAYLDNKVTSSPKVVIEDSIPSSIQTHADSPMMQKQSNVAIPNINLKQSDNLETGSAKAQLDIPVSSPVQTGSGSRIISGQRPVSTGGGADAERATFPSQAAFSKVSIAEGVEVRVQHMEFGVLEAPVDDPHLRRQDLTGIHFRCTTLQFPPMTVLRANADGSVSVSGILGNVLNTMKSLMNFTYTCRTVKDGQFGAFVDGRWTGMVKEVMDGQADMVIANMGITQQRSTVVDFLIGTISAG
ncbi:uncharacterized protein LOC122254123 [Penaeus japonicus]|uniref:uncharacterized protein LOC122254123 n=1 Tax=Penaeus japonicus TaxID=27405 RepID=UPI001C70B467|nr:uncharacterized protein LOC122254123 [Penaeus japonicus]